MLACKGISATRTIDSVNCIKPFDGYPYFTFDINTTVSTCIETLLRINIRAQLVTFIIFAPLYVNHKKLHHSGGLRIIYFYLLFVLAFQYFK